MAYTFKFNKIGCLNLSQACILLGLLDLAINIYIIAVMLVRVQKSDSFSVKSLLILAAIGVLTCLFMMSGSILKNYWSILPHLGWELSLIIIYAVIGVILLGRYSQGDRTIDIVIIIVILSCAPIASFLYWSVIYNRYLEIKEKQFAPPQHRVQRVQSA